jgi:alkanesulfonate monooxygenase SsuD/methylene tetrahydromethanopterin reductase-like flavin-dependent oxidoreductase (luciferase family)
LATASSRDPGRSALPIYIGGNAKRAIRRVVELGDGWNPFFTSSGINTNTTRTAAMTGEEDLAAGIAYMKEYCATFGRADIPEVVLGSITAPGEQLSAQEIIDRTARYRELGVTTAGISVDGRTRAEWCDNAERIGAEVIAKL